MRLTAKELEQMKSVDIGAVAPESLPDVSGMAFDTQSSITVWRPLSSLQYNSKSIWLFHTRK